MKNLTIAGNIGKDAETRTTPSGDKVTSWSVAVEDRSSREKATEWFEVSMWGSRGESIRQYLTKGSKVCVSGDLGRREYNGKTYLTIRADQVTLLGGGQDRRDDGGRSHAAETSHRAQAPDRRAPANPMDDEIPFEMSWR